VSGWIRWPLLLGAVTYLLLRLADSLLLGPLALVAETEARLRGIEALNRIVLGTVGQDLKPDDVVIYDRDKTGRIAAYHINTRLVNAVATEAAAAVKDEFREVTSKPVGVPLGALTGNRLLSSTGPRIHVELIPVGSVVVDIKQEFKAEGINQTRHTISLKATATVRIVLPLATKEVQVSTDVPIADSVIVGDVPQVYGGSVGGVTLPMGSITGR
jgi:sporulation protein YunB